MPDVPAGLTGGALRVGRENSLSGLLLQVSFPDLAYDDVQRAEEFEFTPVLRDSSFLDGEKSTRVDARVGVPEGTVYLKDSAQGGEPEVHDSREATSRVTEDELPLVCDSKSVQLSGSYVFYLRRGEDTLCSCEVACNPFRDLGSGRVAMDIVVTPTSGDDRFLRTLLPGSSSSVRDGVGLKHDSLHKPKTAAFVVALPRAEVSSVFGPMV